MSSAFFMSEKKSYEVLGYNAKSIQLLLIHIVKINQ